MDSAWFGFSVAMANTVDGFGCHHTMAKYQNKQGWSLIRNVIRFLTSEELSFFSPI